MSWENSFEPWEKHNLIKVMKFYFSCRFYIILFYVLPEAAGVLKLQLPKGCEVYFEFFGGTFSLVELFRYLLSI